MRKLLFIGIIGLMAFGTGCSKIKQLANINADIPYTAQVNIPPVSGYTAGQSLPGGGISLAIPSVSVATNSQQYINQYHTAVNTILDVNLKNLALQITAPSGQNFDFMDSVQLYLSADGQPEVLVASQYNIPKGQSTLTLITNTDINLKDYFVQETLNFRLQTHINALPGDVTQMNIISVFHLLANPLY